MRRDRQQTGNTSVKTTLTELEEKAFGLMGYLAAEGLGMPEVLPSVDVCVFIYLCGAIYYV